MSRRGTRSTHAQRAWLTGAVLVLIGSCGGDVLTLGSAPQGVVPPMEAGPETSVPDSSLDGDMDVDMPEAGGDVVLIEAGLPPTFGAPHPLDVINNVNDNQPNDNPTLTDDMLQIFFTSTRFSGDGGPGSSNVWTATRATPDVDFSEPTLVGGGINTDAPELSPAISGDGTKLWFARRDPDISEEDAPGNEIYLATRASKTSNWQTPTRVAGSILNTMASEIPRPPALVDGTWVMPFASKIGTVKYQNWFAFGDLTTWQRKAPLDPLNFDPVDFENVDGFLRDNGRQFYFSSTRDNDNGKQDIFFVHAVNLGPVEQRFPATGVQRLTLSSYNPGFIYKDPWLNPEGTMIFFTSDFSDSREQICEAQVFPAMP